MFGFYEFPLVEGTAPRVLGAVDLIPAVVAYSGCDDGGFGGGVDRDGDTLWRVEEGEVGSVEEVCGVGRALCAEDTAALSTVMSAFKDGKLAAAEEDVAARCLGVGLPERLWEKHGEMLVPPKLVLVVVMSGDR